MKRILLLLLLGFWCYGASAQGPVITVVNGTGYTIEFLYVSSNQSDKWEDDVLGRNVLQNGSSFKITLPENGVYDFKGVDEDGDQYYKWNIIMRGDATITLTAEDFEPDDSRPESEKPFISGEPPAAGSTWVTVVNNTGYDIYYLYISAADSDSWYGDILKQDILEKGKQVRVVLPRAGEWDFKATDKDSDDYVKLDLSMTAGANRVVFQAADLEVE